MCNVQGLDSVLCIINFVEALIFGLFVIIMMFDQLQAIFEGHPADLKLNKHISKYQALQDVFGEKFSLNWFIPWKLTDKMRHDFQIELKNVMLHSAPTSPPITSTSHSKMH
jgi:hypothetical protein